MPPVCQNINKCKLGKWSEIDALRQSRILFKLRRQMLTKLKFCFANRNTFCPFSVKPKVLRDWSRPGTRGGARPGAPRWGGGTCCHGRTSIKPEGVQHAAVSRQCCRVLGRIQHGQQLYHLGYKAHLWPLTSDHRPLIPDLLIFTLKF